MSGQPDISFIEDETGAFLRVSSPGSLVVDIPLTAERRAYLAAECAESLRRDIRRAAARQSARVADWHARDAAAS